jgi:hypothetical protein
MILWDLDTGQPAQTLKVPPTFITSVAWSTDGRLASGTFDNSIRIARADFIHGEFCQQIFRNMTINEWLWLQGAIYVYQPACPNLPVPAFDPIRDLQRRDIQSAMITWKGRALLLGVVLLLLAFLYGIFLILRKFVSWIWNKMRNPFGKKPARV